MSESDLVLSLIVAKTPTGVIGKSNSIPWNVPSDMRRFRDITQHAGTVIMGYETFVSILARNKKPLAKRYHLVLSRNHSVEETESVHGVKSVEEALAKACTTNGKRACVIGGTKIYEQFLPLVGMIHITDIHAEIEGDAHFPAFDLAKWKLIGCMQQRKWDPRDDFESSVRTYERLAA